jgi:D-glycero-alpha-D-manno-heptose-7-phosphate kinase
VNLDELERRLVVCYTGKPRQSGINNWEVFKAHIDGKKAVRNNIEHISQIAQKMRVALESGDWKETGRLMHSEWAFRRRNLPTISTKTIDAIINGARRRGALAGKVCGAGGGGCVVLLIEPDARQRVEEAVEECGGELLPMQIDRQGVTVVSH